MAFTVGAIVSKLQLDKKGWDQSVQGVKSDQTAMAGFADKHGAAIKKMGAVMTAAGGLIVGSLGGMIKSYVTTGDWIDKMSKRTGIGAAALSELAFAADISGATLDDVEKAIKRMAGSIIDADEGLESYARAFRQMGLETDALMKMNPEQQFLAISEAIAELEDPTLRAALAQDVFGRAGTTLLPMMAEGKEGLRALREEAHTLGIVFDEEAAAKAAKLKDEQTRLKDAMKGVGFAMAETLIPAVTKTVTKITDIIKKVSEWIKENPKLAGTIVKVSAGLGALMLVLGPFMMMLPGLIAAGPAIGAGFTAMLGPIGLVVAAVAAAVVVFAKLKKAQNEAQKAGERLAEATEKFDTKLEKIATRAGLTAKEFQDLKDKYEGNTLALGHAILRGQEGVKLQEAMAKVGEENVEVMEKQTEAAEDYATALDKKVIPAVEDWVEYLKGLGIKTLKEKAERTAKLEGILKDLHARYKAGLLDLADYKRATEEVSKEIRDLGTTITATAVPAARDMSGAVENAVAEMKDRIPEVAEEVQKTFITVRNYTDNLINSLGNAFGSFAQNIFTKGQTLSEKLKGLWGGIKNAFTQMLGDMAKDFAVNFITKIVTGTGTASKAMEATGKVFEGVGKTVAGIGEGIGKLIEGLATGIGKALEALAKSIAAAAQSLAAAAPEIAIVLGLAVATYAAFKAVGALFGGGGKKQKQANEYLQDTRNFLAEIRNELISSFKPVLLTDHTAIMDDIKKSGWAISDRTGEIVNLNYDIISELQYIGKNTAATVAALSTVPAAATGAYFPKETLARVAEDGPEIAAPIPVLQQLIGSSGASQGGRNINVAISSNNTFHIQALDPATMRDVVRNQIEPELINSLQANIKKTNWKQALGVA